MRTFKKLGDCSIEDFAAYYARETGECASMVVTALRAILKRTPDIEVHPVASGALQRELLMLAGQLKPM